jgi:ankyrin repeat protein
LLHNGADVKAKTSDGVTALMIASHEGYQEIEKLLIKAGAR